MVDDGTVCRWRITGVCDSRLSNGGITIQMDCYPSGPRQRSDWRILLRTTEHSNCGRVKRNHMTNIYSFSFTFSSLIIYSLSRTLALSVYARTRETWRQITELNMNHKEFQTCKCNPDHWPSSSSIPTMVHLFLALAVSEASASRWYSAILANLIDPVFLKSLYSTHVPNILSKSIGNGTPFETAEESKCRER